MTHELKQKKTLWNIFPSTNFLMVTGDEKLVTCDNIKRKHDTQAMIDDQEGFSMCLVILTKKPYTVNCEQLDHLKVEFNPKRSVNRRGI